MSSIINITQAEGSTAQMLFSIVNQSGSQVNPSLWSDFALITYVDPANEYIRTVTADDTAGGTFSEDVRVIVADTELIVFTTPREVLKVARPNNLVFLHDGKSVPITAPKDPNAVIYKGFMLLGFEDGETVTDYSFLIDGIAVANGQTVNGLTFDSGVSNRLNQVKARLSGGSTGRTYRLTLRYSTQYVPLDDRSQDFTVQEL